MVQRGSSALGHGKVCPDVDTVAESLTTPSPLPARIPSGFLESRRRFAVSGSVRQTRLLLSQSVCSRRHRASSIGPFVCLLDRFDFTGTTGSGHHVRSDFVECSLLALRSDIFFAAPFRPFQPWRTPLSSFPPPPRIKSSFSCSA